VTVRLARAARARVDRSADDGADRARWTCAFVNNMPDAAFDATERQFLELLDAGSGPDVIEVSRHSLAGVPRGERTAARIAQQYSPVGDIHSYAPDLLVVTGSNPLEFHIEDEPYWGELVELLSWGRDNVHSMLLSCLSAHAALSIFDDVTRVRLPFKCTGVFAQKVDEDHPLTAGLDSEILLPHSRQNSVPHDDLRRAGYQIVIESDAVSWSVATRDELGCNVVLVQGHPEYDPSSLLREYHRDANRYVHFARDDLPILPLHCVAPEDWEQLEMMHQAMIEGERDPALIDSYPFEDVGARAPWLWRSMAIRFYANWLASVKIGKD